MVAFPVVVPIAGMAFFGCFRFNLGHEAVFYAGLTPLAHFQAVK